MDDLISRQAAIDAIEHRLAEPAYQHTGEDWYVGMNCAESEIYELPSAQPEPIRINLNEPIKVKLTDWGKEIYYHQYDRTNRIAGREICKPEFPKEDENGYTEFQLWCFMELYIEPLEIVYER